MLLRMSLRDASRKACNGDIFGQAMTSMKKTAKTGFAMCGVLTVPKVSLIADESAMTWLMK